MQYLIGRILGIARREGALNISKYLPFRVATRLEPGGSSVPLEARGRDIFRPKRNLAKETRNGGPAGTRE